MCFICIELSRSDSYKNILIIISDLYSGKNCSVFFFFNYWIHLVNKSICVIWTSKRHSDFPSTIKCWREWGGDNISFTKRIFQLYRTVASNDSYQHKITGQPASFLCSKVSNYSVTLNFLLLMLSQKHLSMMALWIQLLVELHSMFGFFWKSDKDNIPPKVSVQITSHFISGPEFPPAVIKSVLLASKGLCSWVRAVEV